MLLYGGHLHVAHASTRTLCVERKGKMSEQGWMDHITGTEDPNSIAAHELDGYVQKPCEVSHENAYGVRASVGAMGVLLSRRMI